MKKICLALALAAGLVSPQIARAQFANAVISYNPGSGFAAGYTNAGAALGAPSSGNASTPIAPPSSKSQLVSIGAGGEIALQLSAPIVNNPQDPYGINFILFANQFFTTSGGTVNGLYDHAASILVQVSADDSTWFTLNPSLAPQAGTLYPTYGNGNPEIAVNPSLTQANFNGQTVAGVESLYDGSAGGTGYDLSWALDGNGNSVDLGAADYVRIEVQSGVLDLDAIAAVPPVPEPMSTLWALAGAGAMLFWRFGKRARPVGVLLAGLLTVSSGNASAFTEDFSSNPLQNGWRIFGDTNLFQWDATNHNLDVTWDSSQPNSYFYHSLGTILAIDDNFSIEFDLRLSAASATGDNGFELALGLLNFAEAANANFSRPLGTTPDLFEFDYFPDVGFGPTISGTLADGTVDENPYNFYYAYDVLPMDLGVSYHVILNHAAGDPALTGEVLANGQVYSSLAQVYGGPITDFRIDTVSISSYSDAGDTDGDTIFAQGTVDNLAVTLPPPPVQNLSGALSNGIWQAQFCSRSNWLYTLERTGDFRSWTNVSATPTAGNGANLVLQDTNLPPAGAFYRVSASRPDM